MRYLLFIMLSLPLIVHSQDCKVITDTDPYTKETKLSSGFISLAGASLTIDADSKEIDFFFVIEGKCFADGATSYAHFEGTKAKMMYRNSGSMNCDGYFHIRFRNGASTPSQLQRLASQKLSQFVFIANDKKETIITLNPEQQALITKIATCVISEGKKLVK